MPRGDQVQAEGLDEMSTFQPRNAGDADAERTAGGRCEQLDQPRGVVAVVGAGGLDEGDGASQRPPVAGAHRRREILDGRYVRHLFRKAAVLKNDLGVGTGWRRAVASCALDRSRPPRARSVQLALRAQTARFAPRDGR